jgi:aspartate/methionine/tyrosine aminotransferase
MVNKFKVPINPNLIPIMEAPYPFDAVDKNKDNSIYSHGVRILKELGHPEPFSEEDIIKTGKEYVIDLGVGDPTDPTAEAIREAGKKAIDTRATSGYPASIGYEGFRKTVCKWIKKRYDVEVKPNEVVIIGGAKSGIFYLYSRFIDPTKIGNKRDIVIAGNPGYTPSINGAKFAGAEVHFYNVEREKKFDPNKIDSEIVERTKILYGNSPHNPTGKIFSPEEDEKIAKFCLSNDIIYVSDECYSENYYGEENKPHTFLETEGSEECGLIINSLSKRSRMTGWRVGFAISKNPEILDKYAKIEKEATSGVASMIQDAATFALTDEAHVQEMNKTYEERMDIIMPALRKLGYDVEKSNATFYLWFDVLKGEDPEGLAKKWLDKFGINVMPGNLISENYNGINPGENKIRMAMVPQTPKIKEAAERLSNS